MTFDPEPAAHEAASSRVVTPGGTRWLLVYFLLTFAISWLFFIAVAWTSGGPIGSLQGTLALFGAITPSLVAMTLAARQGGPSALRLLLDHLADWRAPARWFVFAATFMVAIKLIVAVVLRLASGRWPAFGHESWWLLVVATLLSTPVQAGEELGWRAFALPRLGARLGLGPASVVLGVVWACWHLPLFFVHGADTYGQSFFVYLLQVTALSVVMAWLYARTRSRLLPVMLLHAAINNTKDIVPSAAPGASQPFGWHATPVAWLTLALLWIVAAGLLADMHRRRATVFA